MFDDYAVIPIARPPMPVDVDRLRAYVHSHCEQCAFRGNRIKFVLVHARKPIVDGRMVWQGCDPRWRKVGDRTRFEWDPAFVSQFPDLPAWVDRLPFRRLGDVCVVTQTADIREHMDIFGRNNSRTYYERFSRVEPHLYRAVVSDCDEGRTRCFFVTEKFGGAKRYVRLPRSTDLFALSSSCCYHGSDFRPEVFKSTFVFHGDVDARRHARLLRASLERYPRSAIRLGAARPVDGPAMVLPYPGGD